MAARGKEAPAAAAAKAAAGPALPPVYLPGVESDSSHADRENPLKLSGEPLRKLAHQRGMAKSELARMPDEKIRHQLRYITGRQYEEAS